MQAPKEIPIVRGELLNKEFTAATAGSGNSATTFAVGADAETTAANLVTAIQANTTLNTQFISAAVAGTNGDNLIRLTEKAGQADGAALLAPSVVKSTITGKFGRCSHSR